MSRDVHISLPGPPVVQPAVGMYFIGILFGLNNCLEKGKAIFFLKEMSDNMITLGRLAT